MKRKARLSEAFRFIGRIANTQHSIKAVHVGKRNKSIVSPFIANNLNRDHASFYATLVADNFCLLEANRA